MPKRKNDDPNNRSDKYLKLTTGYEKSEVDYFNTELTKVNQIKVLDELQRLHTLTYFIKPYRILLLESKIPDKFKLIALRKLDLLNHPTSESPKIQHWIESFLRIPFEAKSSLPVSLNSGIIPCQQYMSHCEKVLNECTYGMKKAKEQFLLLIGKWISNPLSLGTAIGLRGPMGTGKTTLIKNGISKILNREFAFITLGGATDGSYLEGHSYTYEGSSYGRLVDILIQTKTSNPVIFFDELDKVSATEKGNEIIGILTHLTDTTQNSQFHDKYFSEIDLDMSKCLFIFSFNDESLVNPILKDRMYTIEIDGYNAVDKKMIAKNFLIPEIMKELSLPELEWQDDALDYMINGTTEEGVRNLKRHLETVASKINVMRIMNQDIQFPFKMTRDIVESMLQLKIEVETPSVSHLQMYI